MTRYRTRRSTLSANEGGLDLGSACRGKAIGEFKDQCMGKSWHLGYGGAKTKTGGTIHVSAERDWLAEQEGR